MKYLVILTAILILVTGLTACGNAAPTTNTAIPTTGIPSSQPIEVVSVTGPMPPINPGGPTVQITLKNVGQEPVVAVKATLELTRDYEFTFDVTKSQPLSTGASATLKQTLIGGGISDGVSYPLKISATLQSGATFEYTFPVKIGTPPPAK
jgi:hypothetical protein